MKGREMVEGVEVGFKQWRGESEDKSQGASPHLSQPGLSLLEWNLGTGRVCSPQIRGGWSKSNAIPVLELAPVCEMIGTWNFLDFSAF
jgi:hypothetical protein